MRIDKDIVDQQLAKAPVQVRNAIMSVEVAENLAEIAKQAGLHIDQAGILEEESLYVMLGLQSSQEFLGNLRARIGISQDAAMKLAQEINSKVSSAIRIGLQDAPTEKAPATAPTLNPSREDILAGIEDPTPAVHPISAAVPPAPPARPSDDHSKSQPTAEAVAHDFIEGKLAEPVSLPTKKVTVDPYREPLM
jgi:hypothetical protein